MCNHSGCKYEDIYGDCSCKLGEEKCPDLNDLQERNVKRIEDIIEQKRKDNNRSRIIKVGWPKKIIH